MSWNIVVTGPDPMDPDIRVSLVRIEGKLDVTNERLSNVQNDIVEIRTVQRDHGSRLGLLEAKENVRSGERGGLGAAGKAILAIASLLTGTGIGAGLLEVLK